MTVTNETLDRLLRHMAWANASMFAQLQDLPPDLLDLHMPHDERWTVRAIAGHLVSAADFYCHRLGGTPTLWPFDANENPTSLDDLAPAIAEYDSMLREQSQAPEELLTHTRPDGTSVTRARSTITAQAIHHATEHRAQIASILSMHNIHEINLDELDLWAFGDVEGLGK